MLVFLLLFFCVLYLGFFINIPFFLSWIKQKPATSDTFLYTVKGSFSYESVMEQIERIEKVTGTSLKVERKRLIDFNNKCAHRGFPLSRYKKQIHRMLKDKAFGKRMVREAFRRMETYEKVVALWDGMILLTFIVLWMALSYNAEDPGGSLAMASMFGFMIGGPFWLIAHLTLNQAIKHVAKKKVKEKQVGYFFETMAHFYGITSGLLWRDLMWEGGGGDSDSMFGAIVGGALVGGMVSSSGGTYGGFDGGDFGGGGAGGDW